MSTIGPVAVGVVLAFAWNMTVSQPQLAAESEPGVTPRVGLTVEEAATQAWASATPPAATGGSPRSAGERTQQAGKTRSAGKTRQAGQARQAGKRGGAGRSCRVRSPRAPWRTLQARAISACGQRGRAPGHAPRPFGVSS